MGEINLNAEALSSVTIFSVLLLFFLYYYTVKHTFLLNHLIRPLFPSVSGESIEFISEKLTGILFTGLIPFTVFILILNIPPSRTGLIIGRTFQLWYLVIILVLITALASFVSSKSRKVQERSPELKTEDWHPRHLLLSVSAWLCYLIGYEFFFRGVLWFICNEAFGFWPALIINLILYSLVHIPKGKLMTIGAIPFGAILCLLSQLTGSFITAFMIHSTMAIMTEISAAYNKPGIHFHIKRIAQ
jgi:membrane protease YdiL (CAAX protease family)